MASFYSYKYRCNICGKEIPERERIGFKLLLNPPYDSPIAMVENWDICMDCTEDIVIFFSQKITSKLGRYFLYPGKQNWWKSVKRKKKVPDEVREDFSWNDSKFHMFLHKEEVEDRKRKLERG